MDSAATLKEDVEEGIAATTSYENAGESASYEAGPSEAKRAKPMKTSMHLAVVGCSHGEMDRIYDTLTGMERQHGIKFDLLICCGDFQAIRNHGDLQHMNVPQRYLQLMTFYKYYSGEKVAPILTLFVGGNHESSGYLAELPNGGWAAPNIYYMGYSSVVQFGGLRIAGLSGIYKGNDYDRGHFERPPFEKPSLVSAYHVRSVDVFRLRQLKCRDDAKSKKKVNVVVTHDWPAGITDYGNTNLLLRLKPDFGEDIQRNQLGNPATMNLLYELKPNRWFSAHLHVKYTAEVEHPVKEGLEIAEKTKFLALDKPKHPNNMYFLEWLEVPMEEDENGEMPALELRYDPTWLAILKNTDFLTVLTEKRVYMPGKNSGSTERYDFRPTQAELDEVARLFDNDFKIPHNFCQTAPPEKMPNQKRRIEQSLYYRNPQSTVFCEKLGIKDFNYMLCQASKDFVGVPYCCEQPQPRGESITVKESAACGENKKKNPEEIDIGDDDEFGDECFVIDAVPKSKVPE